MGGPFYGSLAASASVFVAILTALLVNNYVQIKSDRRRIINELDRIEEDLEGLKDRRDEYQDTVDTLVEKRESDYKNRANKQVDEFIQSEVPSEYSKPIENLDVEEVYQDLIEFHHCEDADELEDSDINYHHRDILEDRLSGIKNEILEEYIPSFASDYEHDGWEYNFDEDDPRPDAFKKMIEERDPLSLDEFLQEYKNEHNLNDLEDRTIDALEREYDRTVDKNPNPNSSSSDTNDFSSVVSSEFLQQGVIDAAVLADQPLAEIEPASSNIVIGLNVREQQKLADSRRDLRDKENEIKTLKRRKNRLERQKERLHPEDLTPTLIANVATIVFSVVIPVFVYLLFVTNSTVPLPESLWIISHTEVNVFISWVLGLCVVFESIHARINDREPKAYSFYQRVKPGSS
jgi:hypothetical protein